MMLTRRMSATGRPNGRSEPCKNWWIKSSPKSSVPEWSMLAWYKGNRQRVYKILCQKKWTSTWHVSFNHFSMTMRLLSMKMIPVNHRNVLMRDVDWIAIVTDVGAIFLTRSVWNLTKFSNIMWWFNSHQLLIGHTYYCGRFNVFICLCTVTKNSLPSVAKEVSLRSGNRECRPSSYEPHKLFPPLPSHPLNGWKPYHKAQQLCQGHRKASLQTLEGEVQLWHDCLHSARDHSE